MAFRFDRQWRSLHDPLETKRNVDQCLTPNAQGFSSRLRPSRLNEMLSLHAVVVRLVAVLLLAVAFGTSVFEEFIPEYHDGDSTSAVTNSSGPGDAPRSSGHAPDATHVCHCVHAHALSFVETPIIGSWWRSGSDAMYDNATSPRSPALPHHLRPPIA
jgi:hypothetical protein